VKNRAPLVTPFVVCLSLVAAVALTACGGGGGSSAPAAGPAPGGTTPPAPASVTGVKLPGQVSAVTAN
jgi:multidrug efflux pump subunit AcrA (membrane-fusion protein)